MKTKMATRRKESVLSAIKRHTAAIAAHRDALRNIYSELEETVTSVDAGLEDLETAIDKLSETL